MINNKYIKFNIPYIAKNQLIYFKPCINSRKISGNNFYTKKCQNFLKKKFNFQEVLLTTSCTDALEMSAILADIQPGDEVIMPSYTFVSTANAFILRGAKIIFSDSENNNPNINLFHLSKIINKKTKCVVIVHYAGLACDMDKLIYLKKKYKFFLVEDCAHSISSRYKNSYLGSFGDVATFSFHGTKNIQCGEGGALIINNKKLINRAKIIWEKGTNRKDYEKKLVSKYQWVDIGSSFLPNEITAAFLLRQLEFLDTIIHKRTSIWYKYYEGLKFLDTQNCLKLPKFFFPNTINGHIFYIILKSKKKKIELQHFLKNKGIECNDHYNSLHKSKFYLRYNGKHFLKNSEMLTNCLLRLPIYPDLKNKEITYIIKNIKYFFQK